jgi:hypothetical protein
MYEKLIFPTTTEQAATRQLIVDNWPLAKLTYIHDTDEMHDPEYYMLDVEILNINPQLFFKWCYTSRVIIYCYQMSLQMMDPPFWMREVLKELHEPPQLTE